MNILVMYATRFGATQQVAETIAQTLRDEGQKVDLLPIQEISSLDGYHAAFLGSAVNYGNWLPHAVKFVQARQEAFNSIPVALFTVHITNVGGGDRSRRNRQAFSEEVRALLNPVGEEFFAGKFDRRAAKELLPRWIAWLVPTIDLRKWDSIREWTKKVLQKMEGDHE